MRTSPVIPPKLKEYIAPIFLGISGALMGSTIGSGVGSSLPELLLALFLVFFVAFLSIENLLLGSTEHLLILIAGAVAGVVSEYFTKSMIVTVIAGALAGLGTFPVLSRISRTRKAFLQSAPYLYYALWPIIAFVIFTPLYFWASSRGILKETIIAIAFLSSPLWVGYMMIRLSNTGEGR